MKGMSRFTTLLFIGTLMWAALSASCWSPRYGDDKQFAREKVKIAAMASGRDTAGLMSMLQSSEFRSSALAAYWLGRLGVKEALPELERRHQQHSPEPSGGFGAAAARIRVADLPPAKQVGELLKLASDTNPDYVLASEVGRILIDYDDKRILPALRKSRTYGGQETAVRLEMKGLPEAKRLDFLVRTLVKHESPQRAEAAQLLLTEAGAKGADAVMRLLGNRSWEKTSPHPNTVKNRVFHIVSQVGDESEKRRLEEAGWVWGTLKAQPRTTAVARNEKARLSAIARLSDSDYLVRWKAAMELRDMPPDARNIPALIRAADDKEIIVEREALQALAKIDSAEVIPILTRKLDSPIREFRYLAAEALWPRGYKRSVRVFISDLRSDDREIRKWADRRLEKLTGITSDYWYGDPESDREKNVRWWEAWLTKQKR